MYDVTIIGAGVAGTYIARELSRYELKILILDKENDVGNGTSMANSAIIHAGYDAKYSTMKGHFNSLGSRMFEKVCSQLDIEYRKCGSMVVGFDEDDLITIKKLFENGIRNNVEGMKIISGEEARELEPNLSKNITCALLAESAAIISPFDLCVAMAENAVDNGAILELNQLVIEIEENEKYYKVKTENREYDTKYIINCAGVYADEINNMLSNKKIDIQPRKGSYFVMDLSEGNLISRVIFQCPTNKGKGVLITPTVHGNLLIGPDSVFVDDKENTSTAVENLEIIKNTALKSVEKLDFSKVIRVFSGLRASSKKGDFIIERATGTRGLINIAGYDSPGLSSIPAVSEYVLDIFKEMVGELKENKNFRPTRRPLIRFAHLSKEEKKEAIKSNPNNANIICRCETVTEGEILDSINRSVGATTLQGIKKRVRPGSGRCQGSFCSPKVQEILSRELKVEMEDIRYNSKDSYIIVSSTKEEIN